MKKQASTTHFFYQNGKLVTVNQGGQQRAIFRTADMPLAEQQSDGTNGLLATDRSNSVLAVEDGEEEKESDHKFTAYGHDPTLHSKGALLGFNGETFEPATTCYQLGNGYRAYSPALMRFHSPDSWSPFAQGGLNPYVYCMSEPINHIDPSGHILGKIARFFGIKSAKPASRKTSFEEEFDKITPPPKYTLLPTEGQERISLSMGNLDTSSPITKLEYDVLENVATRHRDSNYKQITDLLEQTRQPDQQELYKLLYAADEAALLRASIFMRKELHNGFATNEPQQTSIRRT